MQASYNKQSCAVPCLFFHTQYCLGKRWERRRANGWRGLMVASFVHSTLKFCVVDDDDDVVVVNMMIVTMLLLLLFLIEKAGIWLFEGYVALNYE